ncbi:ATP-binding cassette domain-containing protein [Streptomyces sp. NPDC001455]|uniref:ATP-binding cassette domain-containing protein n=1 Tax=Streptomyces sp. NPDC001455 TaxID=3154518 RepID=UPI0033244948
MTEIHSETGAETNTGPQRTMPFLTRLVAHNPGLCTFATLGWVVFHLWPLVPGLLGKALFDVIEGRAPAGLTIWTLIGLTVAVGLARCVAIIGATVAWAGWYQRARGLIQYNLLRRVFSRPGAQAVPGTMGESISTVRDDSDGIAQMGGWGFDLFSGVVFVVGGVGILLQGTQPMTLVHHRPLYVRGGEPEREAVPNAEPLQRLEVRSLSYTFPGTDRGIQDVSLDIRPGTITVITGEVGSGKTTLLRAMLGLYEGATGEIWWNGERVDDPAEFLVPPLVAYTLQTPRLLSGTLRENVLLGLPDDGRAERAVRQGVLDVDLGQIPGGLDAQVGVRGVRLSGGQVQRVAAARMFARSAPLMVMDDLSSALDVETERELWRGVFSTSATCIVVSHRPAVLERADQVVLMQQGRVISTST